MESAADFVFKLENFKYSAEVARQIIMEEVERIYGHVATHYATTNLQFQSINGVVTVFADVFIDEEDEDEDDDDGPDDGFDGVDPDAPDPSLLLVKELEETISEL